MNSEPPKNNFILIESDDDENNQPTIKYCSDEEGPIYSTYGDNEDHIYSQMTVTDESSSDDDDDDDGDNLNQNAGEGSGMNRFQPPRGPTPHPFGMMGVVQPTEVVPAPSPPPNLILTSLPSNPAAAAMSQMLTPPPQLPTQVGQLQPYMYQPLPQLPPHGSHQQSSMYQSFNRYEY